MAAKIYKVDAFTQRPFSGNPAAVCILESPRTDRWMQGVAREMNLSETAFVARKMDGSFGLRWFTPATEVRLCGHATLASVHILYEKGIVPAASQIRFETLSGELRAEKKGSWIWLDFPAEPARPAKLPEGLDRALGVNPRYVGANSRRYYLIEAGSEEAVRDLSPDLKLLKEISLRQGKDAIHGVIVTSRSSSKKYDFVSRFFAPAFGIDEDPVTGSSHCCLAPFWRERLGKDSFIACQASERGGTLKVRIEGKRVFLGGRAVTVLEGQLEI